MDHDIGVDLFYVILWFNTLKYVSGIFMSVFLSVLTFRAETISGYTNK